MKPYSAYKNSGLPWVGKIPKHWKNRKAKWIFRDISQKGFSDEQLLSATQDGGVMPRDLLESRVVMPTGELVSFKLVEKGDFVISLRSFQGGIEYSEYRGLVSPAYTVLREIVPIHKNYYKYLLKSFNFIDELNTAITGIREGKNINYDDFGNLHVLIPPLDEQEAIAKFLNAKLADIDRYIAEKERLIELLQEQKTALVNQAVTRGLNPRAKMKPSGIAYLGEIPEHWQIISNRRLFRENTKQEPDGTEIPLSLSQKDGIVATDDLKEKTLLTASRDNFKVCLPHDLIANRFKAHLGVFFEVKVRGVVTFHYGVYCPLTNAKTKYFEHLFHSEPYRMIYAGVSNGMVVGLQNLSNQSFYSVKSIVPPIEEQDEILEYVEKVNTELDSAIDMNWNQIEKMQEYRTALIAEAVTGKIDVRN